MANNQNSARTDTAHAVADIQRDCAREDRQQSAKNRDRAAAAAGHAKRRI